MDATARTVQGGIEMIEYTNKVEVLRTLIAILKELKEIRKILENK